MASKDKPSGKSSGKGKGGGSKKSGLSDKTNAKRNTKKGRENMPASDFGLPKQRKYRIDDAAHARDALARAAQSDKLSSDQRSTIRKRVHAKYPSINVTGLKKSGGSTKK